MLLPNLPAPTEGIRHQQPNTQAFLNQRHLGNGSLYIAESRVCWTKDGEERGLSLEYPHIAIHAVSRDLSNFNHPCLYLMIDVNMEDNQGMNGGSQSDSDNEEDESTAMTEIRFVPSDHTTLDPMYKALNECQALHPDPEDEQSDEEYVDDEEDEGDYTVSENGDHMPGVYEDEMEQGLEQHAQVGGNGQVLDDDAMETGQFDDADD